jgi:hypothetical protein
MPQYISSGGNLDGVFPEDDYNFVVDDAREKESRNGNPMIELVHIISHNGVTIRVIDYLVFKEKAFWKIDHFREATGEKLVPGQKVNLEAEDCINRKGRCHLIIDSFEGKSRNKVDDYLPPAIFSNPTNPGTDTKGAGGAKRISLNELGEPEDIPF